MAAITFVLLSDTHELESRLQIPAGDVLIHAGDWSNFSKNPSAIVRFNAWLMTLPHPVKLVVPGNHEYSLEADPRLRSLISNATLLIDEGMEVQGIKIWGSPMTPMYSGAFGRSSQADRVRCWDQVPDDTEVLVTHGPPYGILDLAPRSEHHLGDPELLARVRDLKKLRLHCFGHVHGAAGMVEVNHITFVNAALIDAEGLLSQMPRVLTLSL